LIESWGREKDSKRFRVFIGDKDSVGDITKAQLEEFYQKDYLLDSVRVGAWCSDTTYKFHLETIRAILNPNSELTHRPIDILEKNYIDAPKVSSENYIYFIPSKGYELIKITQIILREEGTKNNIKDISHFLFAAKIIERTLRKVLVTETLAAFSVKGEVLFQQGFIEHSVIVELSEDGRKQIGAVISAYQLVKGSLYKQFNKQMYEEELQQYTFQAYIISYNKNVRSKTQSEEMLENQFYFGDRYILTGKDDRTEWDEKVMKVVLENIKSNGITISYMDDFKVNNKLAPQDNSTEFVISEEILMSSLVAYPTKLHLNILQDDSPNILEISHIESTSKVMFEYKQLNDLGDLFLESRQISAKDNRLSPKNPNFLTPSTSEVSVLVDYPRLRILNNSIVTPHITRCRIMFESNELSGKEAFLLLKAAEIGFNKRLHYIDQLLYEFGGRAVFVSTVSTLILEIDFVESTGEALIEDLLSALERKTLAKSEQDHTLAKVLKYFLKEKGIEEQGGDAFLLHVFANKIPNQAEMLELTKRIRVKGVSLLNLTPKMIYIEGPIMNHTKIIELFSDRFIKSIFKSFDHNEALDPAKRLTSSIIASPISNIDIIHFLENTFDQKNTLAFHAQYFSLGDIADSDNWLFPLIIIHVLKEKFESEMISTTEVRTGGLSIEIIDGNIFIYSRTEGQSLSELQTKSDIFWRDVNGKSSIFVSDEKLAKIIESLKKGLLWNYISPTSLLKWQYWSSQTLDNIIKNGMSFESRLSSKQVGEYLKNMLESSKLFIVENSQEKQSSAAFSYRKEYSSIVSLV